LSKDENVTRGLAEDATSGCCGWNRALDSAGDAARVMLGRTMIHAVTIHAVTIHAVTIHAVIIHEGIIHEGIIHEGTEESVL
jgi:hypothetical protein